MVHNVYQDAVYQSTSAFAYHEAVFDDCGRMTDYLFLDVNAAFEEMTGLKKDDILMKRFVRDIAKDKIQALEWVRRYEPVATGGGAAEFEEYSEEYRRYYSVKAYSPEKNRFATLISNKTFEKKIQEISQHFINSIGSDIDYDRVTDFAYDVAGADYAAFNLFDEQGQHFTTVSFTGIPQKVKTILKMLDFPLVGKAWDFDPVKDTKTKDRDITIFSALSDLSGDKVSRALIHRLEKTFDLGDVAVAKIKKENKVLGDFTLFFRKGNHLKNQDLLRIYLSQLGLFIEKNRLDIALQSNQKMFYTLAEYAPIGFVTCDIGGEIKYANKKLLELMDSPSYEATKSINLLSFPNLQKSGFSEKLAVCMTKDRFISYELIYTSLWGKTLWLRALMTPYKDRDTVIGANIIIDDISKTKKQEEDLTEKASRDPLTKAYNRNALETVLPDRLNESKNLDLFGCIAVVDVDNFKSINDTHGHRQGDSVLKQLASRIKQQLREKDLVIRTGGDEFLIYLHDIKDETLAGQSIRGIFNTITAQYLLQDDVLHHRVDLDVSCSIGASFFPRDGNSVETLMAKADEALYRVKRSGKAAISL